MRRTPSLRHIGSVLSAALPAGFAFQNNAPAGFGVSAILWPAVWLLLALVAIVVLAVVLRIVWEHRHYRDIFLRNRGASSIIKNVSGPDFEHWVTQLFLSIGAKAKQTGKQGDHGIDVVAEYKGKKIGIQCKKYGEWLVGEPAVRDLYGVKWHAGFDMVILVTTGNFSNEAIAWARGKKDLVLINQKLLEQIILNGKILQDML